MSKQNSLAWKRIVHAPLFMPVVCLAVVLLINIIIIFLLLYHKTCS